MPARTPPANGLTIVPLTPDRFGDLEQLFGPRGASSGCWCMFWRLPRAAFRAGKGEPNRTAFRKVVEAEVPGLLAYAGGEPVGWVAVQPRSAFPHLDAIREIASPDDQPVWSMPCFFIARGHRGKGVSRALIAAAAAHARKGGARILEAYPSDLDGHAQPASLFLGVASAFRALGFEEVARRDPHRPVMRLALTKARRKAQPARAAGAAGGAMARPLRPPAAPPARARAASRSRPRSRPRRASARRRDR